jgi:translocation and assembly module TamB
LNKKISLLTALCLPLITVAQTTAQAQTQDTTDRDRSRIVAFLEDNLSGAGRDIRIEGFKGLLSSEATMDSLTVSDEQGVWFTLTDAVLDWKRTALLSGRLEVESLSAASIEINRRPVTVPSTTAPEASVFSLPELPVSVEIGAFSVDEVLIGSEISGMEDAILLSVFGSANLKDGSGDATLEIDRLQGPVGSFHLKTAYSNADSNLDLDLSLTEGQDGLVSTLIGLPGNPDLTLTAKGSGPLDTFLANIELATLGQPRLSGRVGLSTYSEQAEDDASDETPSTLPKNRAFFADIKGDVTPLFDPDYAVFFGPSTALTLRGVSYPDGRMTLDDFSLATNALSLNGALAIGTDALPTSFDVSGVIETKGGTPTLLPLTGAKRLIDRAEISAQYDAARGEAWSATAQLSGYDQKDVTVEDVSITAKGLISRTSDTQISAVLRGLEARIQIIASGISLADSALQTAVGPALSAETQLTWRDDGKLIISDLAVQSQDTQMTAAGTVSGLEDGFTFDGNLALETPRLSRFAPITGRPLKGSVNASAKGTFTPLGGKFDAQITGLGQNIEIGIPKADVLLKGASEFAMSAQRDEVGLNLETLTVKTSAISAQGNGTLTGETADLELAVRLTDIASLNAGISGPLSVNANVSKSTSTGPWQTAATMTGPGGSNASLSGSIANTFDTAALSLSGAAPLGLANKMTTAALVQGTAGFNLRLDGPLALSSVSGTVSTQAGARAVLPATGISLSLEKFEARLANDNAQISAIARADAGGRFTADGRIGITSGLQTDLRVVVQNLTVADPDLYSTTVNGNIAITGALLTGPKLDGALTLGRTDVRVSPVALGAGGDILPITHLSEPSAVLQTRTRAGVLETSDKSSTAYGIMLDLTIDAPNQVYIRGRGLDAELGGRLRLTGTTQNIIPIGQFSLIRGRLSLLGKRIDMTEGQLYLQGNFDPSFTLVAETDTDDLTIQVTTSGQVSAPAVELSSSPELPEDEILAQLLFGRALSDISAFQAAQMAAAVATLTGGGDGLVGSIREKIGLDDLDVTTSDEGDAALRLGKYLSDEVYTDVTIDSSGKSVINLNLDASDTVTFTGSVSPSGSTSLGVFFEKDY